MRLEFTSSEGTAYASQVSTASLGDHSYIVVVGDEAIAVDIQRDLDRFEDVLDDIDARLVGVFETHIHNDYVSGGKRLADLHGATYYLPANTGAPYEHTPLADGETMTVGGWTVRAMHTPGHTFNHTSYVLASPDGPVAIFSGGSMLVGAVGRSDLLGPNHTEALLRHQYATAHRIADELPDPSVVAPTHGSGSFCSASDVSDTTSTVEREKLQNPALVAPTVEAFGLGQVAGYRKFPTYYRHMAPANLTPLGEPPASPLPVVTEMAEVEGVTIADIRPFGEYAAGHIPGSLSFEANNDDAVYMGWTLAWDQPLVLVGGEEAVEEVRTHLHRIGWDRVIARIEPSGVEDLVDGPLATTALRTFADADLSGSVVDVRDPVEHQAGIVAGAAAVHISEFVLGPDQFTDDGRIVIHCQTGYRAGVAAGFAEADGLDVTVIVDDFTNFKGELAFA